MADIRTTTQRALDTITEEAAELDEDASKAITRVDKSLNEGGDTSFQKWGVSHIIRLTGGVCNDLIAAGCSQA